MPPPAGGGLPNPYPDEPMESLPDEEAETEETTDETVE